MKKILTSTLLIMMAMTWSYVHANDTKRFTFCNNTGSAASDLHVTFTSTGGNLTTAVVTNPAPCAAPAIPSNGAVTNTMVLDWGVACVAPGACVTVDVSTTNGPLAVNGGFWTDPTHQASPGIGMLAANDYHEVPVFTANNDCFPPAGGSFGTHSGTFYQGPMSFFDVFVEIPLCTPPPAIPGTRTLNSPVTVHGNSTSGPFTANGNVVLTITGNSVNGSTRFFETEMLALNLSGGSLPPGAMIRESPTLQSTGQTKITTTGGGMYRIESFFDIFTELSLDGGQTWIPSQAPPSHDELQSNTSSSIPTLSQWGLIILGVLVVGGGVLFLRRSV